MFTYLLLLPSFVLAFTNFNDLLNSSIVHNNEYDDSNKLIMEYYDDSHCENYVDENQLVVQECYCEEDTCYLIDYCGENHFTLNIYSYYMGVTDECDLNYLEESLQINTNVCYEGVTYYCPNSEEPIPSEKPINLYNYINVESYNNNDCSGKIVLSEKFEMNECWCNNEDGWCVYPLYCNDDQMSIELYFGNKCIPDFFYDIFTMQPNMCTSDGDVFTCGNDNDNDKNDYIMEIYIICSILFCIGFICLIRCCCVQQLPIQRAPFHF